MHVQGFAIGTERHQPNPETECVQATEDIGYGIGIEKAGEGILNYNNGPASLRLCQFQQPTGGCPLNPEFIQPGCKPVLMDAGAVYHACAMFQQPLYR